MKSTMEEFKQVEGEAELLELKLDKELIQLILEMVQSYYYHLSF